MNIRRDNKSNNNIKWNNNIGDNVNNNFSNNSNNINTKNKSLKMNNYNNDINSFLIILCSKIGTFFVQFLSRKIYLSYKEILEKIFNSSNSKTAKTIFKSLAYFRNINIFFGIKFISLVLFSLFSLLIRINALLSVILFFIFGIIGFFVPEVLLLKIYSDRQKQLNQDLPYIIDLLIIAILSGQNIYNSIKIIIEKYKSATTLELERFVKVLDFGLGRAQAYNSFKEKFLSEDLKNLLFILIQAEKYGSSINEILIQKAKFLRFEKLQKYEQQARRSSILLLFPLVFLILPAFILLVGAPLVFSLAGGFLN